MARARRVLIIGSEAVPFAKTGGLADVLGALPPALARLGWDVTLALPKYRGVSGGSVLERFPVTVGGFTRDAAFVDAPMADGARALLVDCPELFDRQTLYGADSTDYPDNALRFAFLARAALEFAARQGTSPSVVHSHDWQGGLAPVYLKTLYASHPTLGGTPSVFTIHNLAYQGIFDADWLPRLDLGWELFTIDELEFWGRISFLKGAINHADIITTVSPRYAQEIQTPELGFGFDGILRARASDLVGILNGIDTREWDPARDRFLPKRYDADHLEAKVASKAAVLEQYGLTADEAAMARPLIGMVSRMVDQKGFDLIAALAADLPRLDATFVVLGTGEARYQNLWTELAVRHPGKIGVRIGFDEALAHLIEAGSDLFLMPSRFEPCGLNQMYSLRYGTVPVVREVGGLADTVRDYSPATPTRRDTGRAAPKRSATGLVSPKPSEQPPDIPKRGDGGEPNGFVFRDYRPDALLEALTRALSVYRDSSRWRALQLAGMGEDHSWDRSAREYVKIYERAIGRSPVRA